MTELNPFKARHPSAAQYVLALHQPEHRVREQTMQRILSAADIASPPFQDWLKQQNDAGADIFLGMNPLRACSFARTKESVREIRHVYLELDEDAAASLRAIRTDGSTPPRISYWIPHPKRTKLGEEHIARIFPCVGRRWISSTK
jgi:hypothetical protein